MKEQPARIFQGIGQSAATLSPIDEQSGNEIVRSPAIRKARKTSASVKAVQTMVVGERRGPKAETEVLFAGAGAAGTLRMMTQLAIG